MHVVAIHHIHDPAGFQKAEAEALKNGLPPGFELLTDLLQFRGRFDSFYSVGVR
jgi:hypothetical protein